MPTSDVQSARRQALAIRVASPRSKVQGRNKRPIVIKYGGSLLEDPEHRKAFLKDIAVLSKKEKAVLVHGGGKEITRALKQRGIEPRFDSNGRRVTDDATMEVVDEVLGRMNKRIVDELIKEGVRAKGFSGKVDHLVEAAPIAGLGRVGLPRVVNADGLERILADTKLPVFYSVGVDAAGRPININADDFALEIAVTCQAKYLVYLTDTGGILEQGKKTPLNALTPSKVEEAIRSGVITGGMVVKARSCVDAIQRGVGQVRIVKNIKFLLTGASTPKDEGTVIYS